MEDDGIEPLVYLFLISSFKSSASSAPSFTGAVEGAEAMGFAEGGLFSIKASCNANVAVLDFEELRGREAPALDVLPVRTVIIRVVWMFVRRRSRGFRVISLFTLVWTVRVYDAS